MKNQVSLHQYPLALKILNYLWRWIEGLVFIPLFYLSKIIQYTLLIVFTPTLLFSKLGVALAVSFLLFMAGGYYFNIALAIFWLFVFLKSKNADEEGLVKIKSNTEDPYEQEILEAVNGLKPQIFKKYGLGSRFTIYKQFPMKEVEEKKNKRTSFEEERDNFNASVQPNTSLWSHFLRLLGIQSYLLSVHYYYDSAHHYLDNKFVIDGTLDRPALRSFLNGVIAHELAHTCNPIFQIYICMANIALAIQESLLLKYTIGKPFQILFNILVRTIEYKADEQGQVLLEGSPDLLYFMRLFFEYDLNDGFFGRIMADHPTMKKRADRICSKFGFSYAEGSSEYGAYYDEYRAYAWFKVIKDWTYLSPYLHYEDENSLKYIEEHSNPSPENPSDEDSQSPESLLKQMKGLSSAYDDILSQKPRH